MATVSGELRELLPTWAVVVLLPIPLATFGHEGSSRDFAYCYLFLGCAILVAERFGKTLRNRTERVSETAAKAEWRVIVTALSLALSGAAGVFTGFVWALAGEPDPAVPLFAILAALPAIGCVPYFAIATLRPYLAVLASVALLAGVKMAGCVVVVLIYGWNAQAAGHTMLPWERPNLLVWLCYAGASVSSLALYLMARRTFLAGNPQPPDLPATVVI